MSRAIVKGVAAVRDLPPNITVATALTSGHAPCPEGWRELPGASHLSRGRWLVTYERLDQEDET